MQLVKSPNPKSRSLDSVLCETHHHNSLCALYSVGDLGPDRAPIPFSRGREFPRVPHFARFHSFHPPGLSRSSECANKASPGPRLALHSTNFQVLGIIHHHPRSLRPCGPAALTLLLSVYSILGPLLEKRFSCSVHHLSATTDTARIARCFQAFWPRLSLSFSLSLSLSSTRVPSSILNHQPASRRPRKPTTARSKNIWEV
jgi:hypothetical protein